MKVNSQSGITMMSLVIYITSFLVIAGIIASITSFFYKNTSLMDEEVYSAAEYNKLNLYLAKETEEPGNRVSNIKINEKEHEYEDLSEKVTYISFTNGHKYTFDSDTNILYFGNVCLCEDVQDFSVVKDYSYGKETIKVKVQFSNKSYTTKYTMAQ